MHGHTTIKFKDKHANHEADPRKKITVRIDREGEHRTIDT